MIGYIVRRIAYGFLILLGVNAITFALFFAVNTPDDMARLAIGGRYVTAEAIENWKAAHGYDLPLVFNEQAQGIEKITKTVFYERSVPLLKGDLGLSDAGRSINREISERVGPSLALALPTFILGVFVMLVFSLMVVLVRRTKLEWAAVAFAVTVMSVSSLFYIILGQWLFAKTLRLALEEQAAHIGHVRELNAYARAQLQTVRDIEINSPAEALPFILNFSCLSIGSEIMLNALDARGICVSAQSTCNSRGKAISHVLLAMGKDELRATHAVRLSFSHLSTRQEIDFFIRALKEIIDEYATR